jgi:exosortase
MRLSSVAVTAQTSPETRARSHVDLALVALTFGTLWFLLCRHLSGEWAINEQYNYGWFVPFFAAYLFWLRWETRPEPQSKNSKLESRRLIGFLISTLAFLLLFLLPLRVFEIGNPDWRPLGWVHAAIVVGASLLYIGAIGGWPWVRHFAFTVCFIFVAVPWVSAMEQPVVEGLMRVVAAAAAETLALFGVPAQVQGNLIRLPSGLVGVNEACSGVRSLQTSLMIGLLFGELKRLSILRRIALVGGAVAIALIANFLRALFLVSVAARNGVSATTRWHDIAGYAIVALVFAGSMFLAAILARREVESRKATGELESGKAKVETAERSAHVHSSLVIRHSSFLAAALVWLLVVEVAAASWYRAHERNVVRQPSWIVRWNALPTGFHDIKVDEGVRATLHCDEGREVAWQSVAPNEPTERSTNYLFFLRWNPGGSTVLRARAHRPDICLPSVGWQQLADHGAKWYKIDNNTSLAARHITFKQPAGHAIAHTFFCLQEDAAHPDEPRPDLNVAQGVQPDWGFQARVFAVKNGVRNLGQQVLEVVIMSAQSMDDDDAEEKFAKIVRELIASQ